MVRSDSALKLQLSILPPPCLGGLPVIYACLGRLMEPVVFQAALQDPSHSGGLLDKLSETFDEVAP